MFPLLKVLFEWDDSEFITYSSLISTFGIIGSVCGSFFGGKIMIYERRKTLIFINVVQVAGAAICAVESMPVICVGRFLKGVAGVWSLIFVPICIYETVPTQSLAFLGSFSNTAVSVGILLMGCLGLGFQDASELSSPSEVNNYWRFIFLFPIALNVMQVLMVIFVYPQISLVYCLKQQQNEAGLALIKRMYKSDDYDEILKYYKKDVYNSQKT